MVKMLVKKTLLAYLGSLTLLAGAAQAQDVKSYAGYSCLTQSNDMARVGSTFENTGAANRTVACPVVREYMPNDIDRGVVVVVDQNPTEDVSCVLQVREADGTVFDSETQTSSGNMASTQTLNFGPLTGTPLSHVTLYCTIPGTSGGLTSSIVSYRINEVP